MDFRLASSETYSLGMTSAVSLPVDADSVHEKQDGGMVVSSMKQQSVPLSSQTAGGTKYSEDMSEALRDNIEEDSIPLIDRIVVPEMLRPLENGGVDSAKYQLPELHLKTRQEKVTVEQLDSLFGSPSRQVGIIEDGKMAGDPLPFKMLESNGVVVGMLLCCFVVALITSNSLHFLQLSLKDFFSARSRENMFDDSNDNRMPGRFFLSFVFCASMGVLLFIYQQTVWPDLFYLASPYLVLGVDIGGCCVVYLLRTLLFAFVNSIFFDREQNKKWMDSYRLLTVLASLLVLPMLLLVLFNEVDFVKWRIFLIAWLITMEILLVFKTYRIFFEGGLGFLHIILYLCTLEIIPLLSIWKGMVWVTQELTKLV